MDAISQPPSEKIQHAMQELINSGNTQIFIDSCNELLHLPFYSEEGTVRVIQSLAKLNGNFVTKIIRKGLSGLNKVYTSKTFEDESIKLEELCVSLYLKQRNKEDGYHFTPSPAIVVDCAVELCDELVKSESDGVSTQPQILLSRCLMGLAKIYEAIESGKLIIEAELVLIDNPSNVTSNPIDTFKHIFNALKSRINDDLFEELLQQTLAISRRDQKLDFLNLSRIAYNISAMLLQSWQTFLEFPFVTSWFAIQTAKKDVLLHDEGYAKRLPFGYPMAYSESLISQVCTALKTLNSQGNYKLSGDKKRLQLFFDHPEIFLRHSTLCLQLLESNIATQCIQEVFETLAIKLNRSLLPLMTDAQVKANNDILNTVPTLSQQSATVIQILNHINDLERQSPTAEKHHQTIDVVINTIVQAMLRLDNQEPILKILWFWKETFNDDDEYVALLQICVLVHTVLQTKHYESNMDKLAEFLPQLPSDLYQTLSIWYSILADLMTVLPKHWVNKEGFLRFISGICIRATISGSPSEAEKTIVIQAFVKSLENIADQEEIKDKTLELVMSLYDSVPHSREYELALNVAIYVVSIVEPRNAKKYVLDFLKAVDGKGLDRNHYIMADSILGLIDRSSAIEKTEVFQRYLRLLRKSSKETIIDAVNISKEYMSLPVNTTNAIRFFDLLERGDFSKCRQLIDCLNLLEQRNKDDLNEFISFFLSALVETLSSSKDCDLFTKQAKNLILASAAIDAETCQPILACIAGSIAVGTFDENVNDLAVESTCIYLEIRNNQLKAVRLFDVLTIYFELTKAFHQIKSITPNNGAYIRNFTCGLTEIFRLPLLLCDIIKLIRSITEILNQGNIKDENQVVRIMLHLFNMPGEMAPSIQPTALMEHLEKLLNLPLAKRLAQMNISTKGTISIEAGKTLISGTSVTLMKLLVEKTPLSFEQGTSTALFDFVIEQMEKRNFTFDTSIMAMANTIIGKNVTPAEFQREFKAIEEIFSRVPNVLVPLVLECISECYSAGITDEHEIRSLILLLRDWNWQEYDLLLRVNESLGSVLNIPRQLVLAFKETPDDEKRKIEIKRVLDVASQLNPLVIHGGVSQKDGEWFEIFRTLAPHDFHVLMRHALLKSEDICTVLNVYTLSKQLPLHTSPFTMDKASLDADTDWSEDYLQSKALTPGKVTYLILQHLRRLNVNNNDVQTETLSIFIKLLAKYSPIACFGCLIQNPTFQEYMAVFACIMKGSSSLDETKKWLDLSGHHVVVCKEIILEVYSGEGRKREQDDSLKISQTIMHVFATMSKNAPLCSPMLNEHLNCMANIFRNIEDEETIYKLLEFLSTSVRSTATCVDVIAGWNKTESLSFLTKLREKDEESASPMDIAKPLKLDFWLQLLPFVSKAFPNSAKKVGDFLDKMLDSHELDDPLSLGRIPVWFKEMTDLDAGFSQQIIKSWCTSVILYETLSSSDVDAITNLTPSTIQEITKEPGEIEECLFKANAPKTWRDEDSHSSASKESIDSFKRCLKFAKILNEFASIAKQFKENSKVLEKIKEGTHALCSSFIKSMSSSDGAGHGGLYKDLDNVPKELFVLLFSGEDGTSEETLSLLTPHSELSGSLAIAFRRMARSVLTKPTLFAHLKSIVDKIIQHLIESPNEDFQTVQNFIHKQIRDLEPNQDAIHSLQAAGYNQNSPKEDLWYSSSIQVSSNVPHVSSVQQFRMHRVLIQMWSEWRRILLDLNIQEVEFKGEKIKTTDLMNYSDSLETMESQLEAVKKATQDMTSNDWSSLRCVELIQQEKNLKYKIEEQEKQATAGKSGSKVVKLVIIWNNQFLESVKTCSEKIPGCYAPNGFHSEKPVICGLSVDNRIITLFKEEKGNTFTELEDVEVKLFPVGMLVFGVYSSCFSYDTDQLWAAFFKELLVRRLVPKIFLTNVSPGFEWIKRFVKPETNSPQDVTFSLCNSLIPTHEDSFDYEPNVALLRLHTPMADHQMKELIILTPDNVTDVEFQNLQSPNTDKIIEERTKRVIHAIRNDLRLQEMHPESHKRILNKLCFAIRETVKITVNGDQPTEETISSFIDLKKLSSGCEDSQEMERKGKALYCRIILDSIQAEVEGSTSESSNVYECVVNMPNS